MKRFTLTTIIILVLIVLSGCKTQKKKGEDVGGFKKFYHDTTSEFNYFYNAGVIMDETYLSMNDAYQDNYNQILPIWKYTEIENAGAYNEDMDKVIEKMSTMIALHRASHWVDDGYLVMGQAQYLKKDYETAQETFLYLADEFSPSAMQKKESLKKRKKGKNKNKYDKNGKRKMTKKERIKAAKKKRKAREKERKRKKKEIAKRKKMRKKGKKLPAKKKTPKKEEEKKDDEKEPEKTVEDDDYVPSRIRLGNLTPQVETEKPESYFLKHRPAYQEAILWLARTYIERDNYLMARRMIEQLQGSGTTFPDVREQLAEVRAHFYLSQKLYEQALVPLSDILTLSKDKKVKARAAFIMGQINQRLTNSGAAATAFETVLDQRPDYEMEFNARLKLATTSWKTGRGTPEAAKKQLEKMLKDIKNEEFQDAIYFALADIALNQNDRKSAIYYLKKSAWTSIKNQNQKTESYLLLADLFYEDEDYINAKSYYDSTSQIINKLDERYTRVQELNTKLTEIAANLVIVETQDSLLRLSELPEDEKALIAAKIKKKRDEEKRAKLANEVRKQEMINNLKERQSGVGRIDVRGGASTDSGNSQSSFFAYKDAGELRREMRDFERQWGSRELSDNWRRSAASTFGKVAEEVAEELVAERLTDDDISKILGSLPETPEQKAEANKKIEAALFELGGLFRDRLDNQQEAIDRLEELLRRYPNTEHEKDVLYMLYLSYKQLGNSSKAQYYADLLIEKYPVSTYAKLIRDPSFIKEILSDERKLQVYYEETYGAFTDGKYQIADERIQKVSSQFGPTNKLQARFDLLKAMISGSIQGKETYIAKLKEVIAKYPDSPEQVRAKEMLRLLGEGRATGPGQNRPALDVVAEDTPYKLEDDKTHYVLVVLDIDASMNKAKAGVVDYHNKYNKLDKLRVSNIYLAGSSGDKTPMIVVRRFENKDGVMTYYNTIQKNSKDFLPGYEYTVLPVTQNNYRTILRQKSLDGYEAFFEVNYK